MQFTAVAMMAAIASTTSAAPVAETRQFEAQLHFFGAAGTEYTISAPTTGTSGFTADEPLAINLITLDGGATCTLFGVDGGSFTVVGAHSVTVAPPQAITSGSCLAL